MEFKLWALIMLIFDRHGLRRPAPDTVGYVLDAGANDGQSAEMMAVDFERMGLRVLAVEPLLSNIRMIEHRAKRVPNLEVLHAGLGATNGTEGHYPHAWDSRQGSIYLQISLWNTQSNHGSSTYPILTIDSLFAPETRRTLVLAHLDLEGLESDALSAANETIMRDRPVITVETYPQMLETRHRAVMDIFERADYDVHTINERVGGIPDGRNRIAVPRESRHLKWIIGKYFAEVS